MADKYETCQDSEEGAVLLELAISVPVLILIVFGMVEFSNLMRFSMTMSNIAYESSRTGGVDPDLENGQFSNLSGANCSANSGCDRQFELQSYISKLVDAYGIGHFASSLDIRTAQYSSAPSSDLPPSTPNANTLASNSEKVVAIEVMANLQRNEFIVPIRLKTTFWSPYLFQSLDDNPPPGPPVENSPYTVIRSNYPDASTGGPSTQQTTETNPSPGPIQGGGPNPFS